MPSAHARIGPSSLARVRRCPGSVRETEGVARRSTEWAAEGTVLHEIADQCLTFGLDPDHYIGLTLAADGFSFVITEDMALCMVPGLDWLREQPGLLYSETRVMLDPWLPGQFGTTDVGIYDPETETATVFDWKFGVGVPVTAPFNDQIRAYGLGFFQTVLKPLGYTPKRWRLIIEQPRCAGGGSFGAPWEISHDELLAFGADLDAIWAAVSDPNAPLKAGPKQCQFCDAKGRPPAPGALTGCTTYDAFHLELIDSKFDDLDEQIAEEMPLRLPSALTAARRSHLIQHAGMIEKFFAKLHEDALADAIAGNPIPGLKAVEGRRGDRKWRSDELDLLAAQGLLESVLADKTFNRKLISPAEAEKALAPKRKSPGHPVTWAALQKLVTQSAGKPVLAPEDDERPALLTVDQKFDEEDDLLT